MNGGNDDVSCDRNGVPPIVNGNNGEDNDDGDNRNGNAMNEIGFDRFERDRAD